MTLEEKVELAARAVTRAFAEAGVPAVGMRVLLLAYDMSRHEKDGVIESQSLIVNAHPDAIEIECKLAADLCEAEAEHLRARWHHAQYRSGGH